MNDDGNNHPEENNARAQNRQWSHRKHAPVKIEGLLGILAGAVLVFALMKGIERAGTKFQEETPINPPPPQFDNQMGPCFNALSQEDKSAVIFAIITYVRPTEGESLADLSKRLYERGEDWAAPERLKSFRQKWKAAEKSANRTERFMAQAASSIASGKGASIGGSAQSK